MGIKKVTVEVVCCDRCGSEKDTRDTTEREWGHTFLTYKGNTGSRDMWGNGAGTKYKGDDIFLCLDCSTEFVAWLDKPKKDIRESYKSAPQKQEPLSKEELGNDNKI